MTKDKCIQTKRPNLVCKLFNLGNSIAKRNATITIKMRYYRHAHFERSNSSSDVLENFTTNCSNRLNSFKNMHQWCQNRNRCKNCALCKFCTTTLLRQVYAQWPCFVVGGENRNFIFTLLLHKMNSHAHRIRLHLPEKFSITQFQTVPV